MNLSELVPAVRPMTEAEETLLLEKLWDLLARQTELYTMGESTSVPAETARELLASICYTLRFEAERFGPAAASWAEADLREVLKQGQAHLLETVKAAKQLWAMAYAAAQDRGKRKVLENLAWMKPFFQEYDLYFFAHRTPWDMGLPMPEAEGERKKGISCVEAYLMGLLRSDLA